MHTHTTFSDGDLEPAELVKYTLNVGLKALSITDHDTVEGLDIAEKECANRGLKFIPGIEFTSKLDIPQIELHILGYGFDREDPYLLKKTDEARNNAIDYSKKVCSMLESHDWIIDYSMLEDARGIITKHDICTSVIKGDMSNYDFHNQWLAETSPFYVEIKKFSARETIRTIHKAGGKAICAHLLRTLDLYDSMPMLPFVAESLIQNGIDGFEVFYGNSTKEQVDIMYGISDQHNLLITGGSDFHGQDRTARCSLGKYNTHDMYFDQRALIESLERKNINIESFADATRTKEPVL
ncbi:PHP domain-containing protein [Methanolobus sp. ZRKC2]|uniref:PHP domain-containing protein n=1 Tax=Methanolobus sp. ZRKC2 TaxID=3125783 RepID=UPI00324FE61F